MTAPIAREHLALIASPNISYPNLNLPATDGTVAEPRPSAFSLFAARCARALTALAELPRRRAVLDELAMLSDRELADIGLSRAELGRVFDPMFNAARSQPLGARQR